MSTLRADETESADELRLLVEHDPHVFLAWAPVAEYVIGTSASDWVVDGDLGACYHEGFVSRTTEHATIDIRIALDCAITDVFNSITTQDAWELQTAPIIRFSITSEDTAETLIIGSFAPGSDEELSRMLDLLTALVHRADDIALSVVAAE